MVVGVLLPEQQNEDCYDEREVMERKTWIFQRDGIVS